MTGVSRSTATILIKKVEFCLLNLSEMILVLMLRSKNFSTALKTRQHPNELRFLA